MSHLIRSIAVVASLILSPVAFAQETYSNPTLGFSIRKPSSWHYLSAEQHRENLKRSDFSDPKFKELVTRYARTPFLAMTKYKEPYEDLNPSLRVNAREAGNLKGMPPEKVVELTASSFARMFKDYAVAEGPLVDQSFRPCRWLHARELHARSWWRSLAHHFRTLDRAAGRTDVHHWRRHAPGREDRDAQRGARHHRYHQDRLESAQQYAPTLRMALAMAISRSRIVTCFRSSRALPVRRLTTSGSGTIAMLTRTTPRLPMGMVMSTARNGET